MIFVFLRLIVTQHSHSPVMAVRRFLTQQMQKIGMTTYTKVGSGNAAAFLSEDIYH